MEKRDMLTAKDIRRAAELLEKDSGKVLKVEGILEVENPRERTDFLRIIEKKDLVNCKLVIDNEGNTKQIYVKPTLLI